ncbi:MAG: Cys-tRNA(Pro) deacylase [Corynebacterium sp.]|nr:Cys-tRNA(Pro) deacylase [Corynebacterium sp.]
MVRRRSRAASTPALQVLADAAVVHRVHSFTAGDGAYGENAARELGLLLKISSNQVFKTLVIDLTAGRGSQRRLAVAILPVTCSLSLKKVATAFGTPKASMADPADAQRSTGYIPGGISPIGQKRPLPTVIDKSAQMFEEIFVSAGKRGLDVGLSPHDLAVVTNASFADICA